MVVFHKMMRLSETIDATFLSFVFLVRQLVFDKQLSIIFKFFQFYFYANFVDVRDQFYKRTHFVFFLACFELERQGPMEVWSYGATKLWSYGVSYCCSLFVNLCGFSM